jgi:prolycopene isomerase
MKQYDVVVIGAGNAGLTAAATLARKKLDVLVLERHNIPGGCATSFCRGRFEFEVALHQLSGIGTPEKPGPLRSTLEQLGVMEKLSFVPMNDLYRLIIPDQLDITLRPDRNQVVAELGRRFPAEKDGIQQYLDLVYEFFVQVIGVYYLRDPEASPEKYPLYFKYGLKTTQEVMDAFINDPLAQAALSPYWTYLGLPPNQMAFVDMAAMLFSYIEFLPFHLKNGSQALSNALADTIIENGGTIRFNCGVKEICVQNGAVQGVVTEQGEQIAAQTVISNASKVSTYAEMTSEKHVPESARDELRQCTLSPSAFTLYIGLDCPPDEVGITESTNFILPGVDMEAGFETMKRLEIGEEDGLMLTCYNLIDPGFAPPGASQIALITLKFGDTWLQVPPDRYADEKYRLAASMLTSAERFFPGLRDHIEEMEIATPITHMRYLGHPKGAIYGFENHIKDSDLFIPNVTHIDGLYCAGGSTGLCGFQPTLDSGVITAKRVIRSLSTRERG